eukprot:15480748-Alexandrium_andersonii.AAC.1
MDAARGGDVPSLRPHVQGGGCRRLRLASRASVAEDCAGFGLEDRGSELCDVPQISRPRAPSVLVFVCRCGAC